jgi:phosphoglycerate dehydrogenase-like enzyme
VSDTITVAVGFKVAPDVIAAIEGVDPRIRTVQIPELVQTMRFRPDDKGLSPEDVGRIKSQLAEADILFGHNTVANEFLEAAANLKWFQVINAGVERLAGEGMLNRGFAVTNASGLAAIPIAEYIVCMMLMLAKDIHKSVRAQANRSWDWGFTGDLTGQTLGIVGMGAIGRETARLANAFRMRVLATRRTVEGATRDDYCEEVLPYSQLDRLLAESDFLAICVPLTPETRQMIGAAELAKMKPASAIINIARGSVIDQDALIKALKDGTIGAAALDVTDPEPLPPESELWGMENVIITPHISGAVKGYGHRAAEIFVANLERWVRAEPLQQLVSAERGY